MAELVIKGIQAIKVGAIAGDGGMGTTLAQLCTTVAGSCTLETAEGEEINLEVEESNNPNYSETLSGVTTLKWRISDFTPETMQKVLGGTVTGTGATKVWAAPTIPPVIEQSLSILLAIPSTGKIDFPRVSLKARLVSPLDKKQFAGIEVVAKVLLPTKAGVAPWSFTPGA